MDYLQEGIHLRAYGQKDPLTEYRREAHLMFEELTEAIQAEFVRYIYRVQLVRQDEPGRPRPQRVQTQHGEQPEAAPGASPQAKSEKVPRNAPCPCGERQEVQEVPRGRSVGREPPPGLRAAPRRPPPPPRGDGPPAPPPPPFITIGTKALPSPAVPPSADAWRNSRSRSRSVHLREASGARPAVERGGASRSGCSPASSRPDVAPRPRSSLGVFAAVPLTGSGSAGRVTSRLRRPSS